MMIHAETGWKFNPNGPLCSQSIVAVTLQSSDTYGAALLLTLLSIKRHVQTKSLACRVSRNSALGVGFSDELLATSVDKKTDEVRAHVMAGEISQRLGQVAFIEVNLSCS
jgi:hypothetical protein